MPYQNSPSSLLGVAPAQLRRSPRNVAQRHVSNKHQEPINNRPPLKDPFSDSQNGTSFTAHYDANPSTPVEVEAIMKDAGVCTRRVDRYMFTKLNPCGLFTILYIVQGKRTVSVQEGNELSTFSCSVGCKNLRNTNGDYKILGQQGCQAVYDHVTSKSHCNRVRNVPGGAPEDEAWYCGMVSNRLGRTAKTKWDERTGAQGRKRKKSKVGIAPQPTPSDDTQALFSDTNTIAGTFLNGMRESGGVDPSTFLSQGSAGAPQPPHLPVDDVVVQATRLRTTRSH